MADNTQEHVALYVAGQPFEVATMSGEESVSRLFRFDLVCRLDVGQASPEAMIAAEARIVLYDSFGKERHVNGLVTEAEERISDEGTAEMAITVRPHAYALSLGRQSRVFQDKTVVEIVTDILGRSAQKTRWEVISLYAKHEYCAQYREDDWTFAVRMLAEEGIYFWFDHDGGATTLVFADQSTIAPDLSGGADVVFAFESGMTAEQEIVEEIGARSAAAPTRFTIASFNHQKPALKISGGAGDGSFEVYDAPGGGPDSPDASARQAKIMKEAAVAASAGITGLSTSVRLVPGMVVRVVGSPLDGNDRFFLTRATYEANQARRGTATEGRPYRCAFEGIASSVPFRPPAEMPPARQAGLQTGTVVGASGDEIMPDATGRVRIQLKWDRDGQWDDKAGKWMRVAQRGTEESMLLPRVGWNVMTFNEEGEIDAPSVLSRIHDAEHPPTYPLPEHKTRVVFKTATSPADGTFNEIYFEDRKGAEEMFLNASKDMNVLAQQVKSESVQRDSTRTVGVNHDLTVGSDWSENILVNQRVSIGSNEDISIGKDRLKTVKQNETVKVGGTRKVKTGFQHTISVTKKRNLKVGAAVIELTTGGIATVSGIHTTVVVGGSDVKTAKLSISEDTGKNATQVVGGSKIEISGLDMPADAGNQLSETVSGGMFLKAGGAFIDGAHQTAAWEIGGALNATAPEVYVEAVDKIEVRCGGSVITILPESVEISAPSFDLSGAQLTVDTLKVEHN
ncbi:type VI secretion system Vgr family protein [Chondromyces apiculatus]|uniref:VgrG protein n=1 Tax=Chondromyces apiculatus DSM 436 TaxID=1192034 RepID=A0A017TAU5_9BACT|nr:type VI secretion system tip protein TssI/VgrG [Chondromyces apiculatus]EYF06408.1 VgrG protein [Chondromyces apiculatus DSM 436]